MFTYGVLIIGANVFNEKQVFAEIESYVHWIGVYDIFADVAAAIRIF